MGQNEPEGAGGRARAAGIEGHCASESTPHTAPSRAPAPVTAPHLRLVLLQPLLPAHGAPELHRRPGVPAAVQLQLVHHRVVLVVRAGCHGLPLWESSSSCSSAERKRRNDIVETLWHIAPDFSFLQGFDTLTVWRVLRVG